MQDVGFTLLDGIQDAKALISAPRGIQLLLHVHLGLLLFGIAFLLLRHLRIWLPLLLVTAIQVTNEAIDWIVKPSFRLSDALIDTANTLFWPAVLTLVIWQQRRRYRAIPYPHPVPPRRPRSKAARPAYDPRDATSDDDVRVMIRGLLSNMKTRSGE